MILKKDNLRNSPFNKNSFNKGLSKRKKYLVFFTLISILSINVYSQTDNVQSLEKEINRLQKQRLDNIFSRTKDTVFSHFNRTFKDFINDSNICSYLPDTSLGYLLINPNLEELPNNYLPHALMNNITILSSKDNKLNMFSYDNLDIGTIHTYTNYLIFKNKTDSCSKISIDSIETIEEAAFYYMETLSQNNATYYLLFGYGTNGSGKHYKTVVIFQAKEGTLSECLTCYPQEKNLIIYSNRYQDIELKFDSKTKELFFKAFKVDEATGFYSDDFSNKKYKFENGLLLEIESN